MKRLIVMSVDLGPDLVGRAIQGEVVQSWIYAGHDVRLRLKWEQGLRQFAAREVMGERLQRAADDLSKEFNDWIDLLGQRYDGLGWWLGQIAEKNPFVSQLFFHICYLKSIIDLVQCTPDRNWLVVVENRGLRRALLWYAQNAGWHAKEIARWSTEIRAASHALAFVFDGLRARMMLAKRWFLLRYSLGQLCGDLNEAASSLQVQQRTILIHSWLRDDSVSQCGEFIDHFFGVLPKRLKEQGHNIQYYVLPASLVAKQSRLINLLRPLAENGCLFPAHRYLKWADLLAAIFLPVLICWLPRRVSRFGPWNIGHLLAEERWSQVWSARTSSAYLYYAFAKRLGKAGKSFYRVIGTFENHIWEKALYWGIRHYGVSDKLIGFQHTCLGWNSHNCSPGSLELQSGVLPDTVVCTGSVWADQLRRQGCPSVITGGALRFESRPSVAQDSDRVVDVPVILVTSNSGELLTLEVLQKVYLAFGDDDGKEIWIKPHPHLTWRSEDYEQVCDGKLPGHFYIKSEPVAELLSSADLLLYSSTVVCFEALARGIPVLSVVPETFIDLDDLRYMPRLRCAAASAQTLRQKATSLLTRSAREKALWVADVQRILETVFTPVTAATIDAFVQDHSAFGS